MKLGPVTKLNNRNKTTKLNNRNKTTSKIFGDDVMLANCNVIVIFLIYGEFGAIWNRI